MDPNKENEKNPLLKESLEATQAAVGKVLASVDEVLDKNMEEATKMPSDLIKKLDPYSLGIAHKDTDIKTGTEFKIQGVKSETGEDINSDLAKDISTSNLTINSFMPNGNHAFIRLVDQNVYLEENFPVLKQSLDLFIDSVLNGSFTGYDPSNGRNMFKFYNRSGSLIDDETLIKTYNEYLNPTKTLGSSVKTFMDLEKKILSVERRDGLAIVRYTPYQKVLKELYIKYLLKKTKASKIKKETKTIKIARVPLNLPKPATESIYEGHTWTELSGLEGSPITINEWKGFGYSDAQINKFGIETVYDFKDSSDSIEKQREYREVFEFGNESFINFIERYTTGETQDLLLYNPDTKPYFDENGKAHYKKVNQCVGFESGRYTRDTALDIIQYAREHMFDFGDINSYGTESESNEYKFIYKMLDGMESLNEVSFGDIYDTCWSNDVSIDTVTYGTESEVIIKQKLSLNKVQSLFYDTLMISDASFSELNIGLEAFDTVSFTDVLNSNYNLNNLDTGDNKPKSQLATPMQKVNDNAITRDNKIFTDGKGIQLEKIPHGRIQKLFESVRGGVVEILEGQRCVPIFAGSRALGVFYITHTHELMRNLILTRQFMNQPKNFMNITDTEYEFAGSQEELVGRMMFSDHIKPIIEKNISTKFLRENAEIMYTINKILEEQELSNSLTYADISSYNMMNLSRVIFIPASDLHIARNTDTGFGESYYQKARVPANFRIAGNEAYLGWVVQDGKPINLFKVQSGLTDGNGLYGVDNALRQIQSRKLTRGSLRRIGARGQSIGAENIIYQTQSQEDLITHTLIPGSENRIERDFLRAWEVEATTIVGFSSALFTSEDGRIELARKLADLDEIQTHRVFTEQKRTVRAASQRATKLLHLRGGSSTEDIIVEYIPPYLTRDNNIKHSEILKEFNDTFQQVKELYDSMFEGNSDYEENKNAVYSEIIKRMNISDSLIMDRESIVDAAVRASKTEAAINIEEK